MGKRRPATPSESRVRPSLHGAVPDAELDLHGQRAAAALSRARGFLERCARQRPGAVVRIVTGKGLHSEGEPVLLGAVEEMLREERGGRVADFVRDRGGGGWLIRLGGD